MNARERKRKPGVSNSISRVYLAAFYLLILSVCALSSALAQRQAHMLSQTSTARPTPTPRPRTTPVPRPTPRPNPALDRSVAYQNNTVHDGYDANSPLVPPLTLKW